MKTITATVDKDKTTIKFSGVISLYDNIKLVLSKAKEWVKPTIFTEPALDEDGNPVYSYIPETTTTLNNYPVLYSGAQATNELNQPLFYKFTTNVNQYPVLGYDGQHVKNSSNENLYYDITIVVDPETEQPTGEVIFNIDIVSPLNYFGNTFPKFSIDPVQESNENGDPLFYVLDDTGNTDYPVTNNLGNNILGVYAKNTKEQQFEEVSKYINLYFAITHKTLDNRAVMTPIETWEADGDDLYANIKFCSGTLSRMFINRSDYQELEFTALLFYSDATEFDFENNFSLCDIESVTYGVGPLIVKNRPYNMFKPESIHSPKSILDLLRIFYEKAKDDLAKHNTSRASHEDIRNEIARIFRLLLSLDDDIIPVIISKINEHNVSSNAHKNILDIIRNELKNHINEKVSIGNGGAIVNDPHGVGALFQILLTRIILLEERMSLVEGRVTNLEARVTSTEQRLTLVENRVTKNESDIKTLQDQMRYVLDELIDMPNKFISKTDNGSAVLRDISTGENYVFYVTDGSTEWELM